MGGSGEASATMPTTAYWVELDRHYRITAACDGYAAFIGNDAWLRAVPDIEEELRPAYERAWRNGYAEAMAMFNGRLWRLEAMRTGDKLRVKASIIDEIDTTTLGTLEASLHRVADALSAHAASEAPRPVLRVV